MAHIDFNAVLRHLGESVGIEGLVLEDGACTLSVGEMIVRLNWDEEAQLLYIRAGVGQVNEDADNTALYEELLSANCVGNGTGGLCLGLDAIFWRLFLIGRLRGGEITAVRFLDYFEDFVNLAEIWRERIKAVQEGRKPASSRPEMPPSQGIRI